MNHHPNDIILIITGIISIMYLAQKAMFLTLFSEEEIKEMNEIRKND